MKMPASLLITTRLCFKEAQDDNKIVSEFDLLRKTLLISLFCGIGREGIKTPVVLNSRLNLISCRLMETE